MKLSAIFITLLLIAVGLLMWLRYAVNQDHLQPLLADILGPDYQVEMQSARILPIQRRINIGQLSINSTSEEHLRFDTDTLSVSGIGLIAYLRDHISISSLYLNEFSLSLGDFPAADNDDPPADSGAIQRLGIQNIDIINGHVSTSDSRHFNNLNFKGGLSLDIRNETESQKPRENSITIDSLGFLFSEDRYRLAVAGASYDELNRDLNISEFKLNPVGGYDKFMSSLTYEANMFDISSTDIAVTGIDPETYRDHNILKAAGIDVESFNIHVSKNKQLPEDPDKDDPLLPNQSIAELPFAVRFDSLHFKNSDILYSQQAEDGARPGTISFMNSTIRISDVNSSSALPARIVATTYLENQAELNTELNFTLNEGSFHMTGKGHVDAFDPLHLNSILKDLEGLEIENGYAHELDFDFEMVDDTSSGNMHLVYEALEIKRIDKVDHSVNTTNAVRGFLLNNLALRAENLPDDDNNVRSGEINHQREPEDSFFRYLWHTLRSGIYDIILRVEN